MCAGARPVRTVGIRGASQESKKVNVIVGTVLWFFGPLLIDVIGHKPVGQLLELCVHVGNSRSTRRQRRLAGKPLSATPSKKCICDGAADRSFRSSNPLACCISLRLLQDFLVHLVLTFLALVQWVGFALIITFARNTERVECTYGPGLGLNWRT